MKKAALFLGMVALLGLIFSPACFAMAPGPDNAGVSQGKKDGGKHDGKRGGKRGGKCNNNGPEPGPEPRSEPEPGPEPNRDAGDRDNDSNTPFPQYGCRDGWVGNGILCNDAIKPTF